MQGDPAIDLWRSLPPQRLQYQAVVEDSNDHGPFALSSGEAELHGINASITQALGLQSIAKDLGFTFKIRVHSDATAALGICRRRGLGKVRHLDVADLWAQDKSPHWSRRARRGPGC